MKKNSAFTLAEVLITMALIGVVAALSIPTITTGIKTTALETQIKKVPTIINDAIVANQARGLRSPLDFIPTSGNTTGNNVGINEATEFANYLKTNLDIVDEYDAATGEPEGRILCLKDGACITVLSNLTVAANPDGGYIAQPQNNNSGTGSTTQNDPIELNLGQCGTKGLNIGGTKRARMHNPCLIMVDVNGDKAPNELILQNSDNKGTSDRFVMYITDSGAIIDPNNTRLQHIFGN